MLQRLITTEDDYGAFVLRVVLGAVMFAHGAQKLFGWWGGHGPAATVQAFAQWFQMPAALTWMVILIESIGSLLLIVGVLGRVWALGIGGVMIGAIMMLHRKVGFYMNWYGTQRGEGFEYHLLVLAMVLALLIKGSGALSVDRMLSRR